MSETRPPLKLLSQEAIEAAATGEGIINLEDQALYSAPYLEKETSNPVYGEQIADLEDAYSNSISHEAYREPKGVEVLPYVLSFGKQIVAQRKLAREDGSQYDLAA